MPNIDQYKIGQKVKIVKNISQEDYDEEGYWFGSSTDTVPLNTITTIKRIKKNKEPKPCIVLKIPRSLDIGNNEWYVLPEEITPYHSQIDKLFKKLVGETDE